MSLNRVQPQDQGPPLLATPLTIPQALLNMGGTRKGLPFLSHSKKPPLTLQGENFHLLKDNCYIHQVPARAPHQNHPVQVRPVQNFWLQ
jgi:hypothetical protein